MLSSAHALVKTAYLDAPKEEKSIIEEFRKRFYDTKIFFDPYAGAKFASYFFSASEKAPETFTQQSAHHRIEEASLFLEASHSCNIRMSNLTPT